MEILDKGISVEGSETDGVLGVTSFRFKLNWMTVLGLLGSEISGYWSKIGEQETALKTPKRNPRSAIGLMEMDKRVEEKWKGTRTMRVERNRDISGRHPSGVLYMEMPKVVFYHLLR